MLRLTALDSVALLYIPNVIYLCQFWKHLELEIGWKYYILFPEKWFMQLDFRGTLHMCVWILVPYVLINAVCRFLCMPNFSCVKRNSWFSLWSQLYVDECQSNLNDQSHTEPSWFAFRKTKLLIWVSVKAEKYATKMSYLCFLKLKQMKSQIKESEM